LDDFISDILSTLFEDELYSNVHPSFRQLKWVVELVQVWRSTSPHANRNRVPGEGHFLMVPLPVPKGKLIIDPLMNKNGLLLFLVPPGEVQTRNDN